MNKSSSIENIRYMVIMDAFKSQLARIVRMYNGIIMGLTKKQHGFCKGRSTLSAKLSGSGRKTGYAEAVNPSIKATKITCRYKDIRVYAMGQ